MFNDFLDFLDNFKDGATPYETLRANSERLYNEVKSDRETLVKVMDKDTDRLFRFMEYGELIDLLDGKVLTNTTAHDAFTSSVGFCFMNEKDLPPEEAYKFLSGIVSDEVCVVFKTSAEVMQAFGVYASPYGSFTDCFAATEYCTPVYDLENFEIVKVCDPDNWEWTTDADYFLHGGM